MGKLARTLRVGARHEREERDRRRRLQASLGSEMKVTLYSGGQPVRTWTSTGKVTSGDHGTRFAFVDKETGAYVRVTGNVSVEEIK